MSEFAKVTAVGEEKAYFNGNVTSRAIRFAEGSVKTLGIMMPGKYAFSTEDWIPVMGGQSF